MNGKKDETIQRSKQRLTLQVNWNHITATKSCWWQRMRGTLVISHCSVEVLATAFQWSCLAVNSTWWRCQVSVHRTCSLHSVFLMFSQSMPVTWKTGKNRYYCVWLPLFYPKLMEIKAGSLLWLHFTGGVGSREGDDSSMTVLDFISLLIAERAA